MTISVHQTSARSEMIQNTGFESERSLEQTLAVDLVTDYNDQLHEIAERLRSDLDQKNRLRDEIRVLQETRPEDPEAQAQIQQKQEEVAGLNTENELLSLEIQMIVDQRKQALTLLSHLIASHHETLMTIARNIS